MQIRSLNFNKINWKKLIENDYVKVALILLLSRGLFLMVGFIYSYGFLNLQDDLLNFERIWARLDAGFYKAIATNGYEVRPYDPNAQNTWAFMPLYPLVVSLVMRVLNLSFFYSAVIVSNISTFFAVLILYKTLKDRLSSGWDFLVFFLFSAGSFYLSVPYTESLYLLFIALTFYFTKKKQYYIAFFVAGLSVITRVQSLALFLIPAVALVINNSNKFKISVSTVRVLFFGTLLFSLPLGSFMLYLNSITENPLAFLQSQAAWNNSTPYPFQAFFEMFAQKSRVATSYIHLIFWIPFIFLMLRNRKKIPLNELLFCLGLIGISTATFIFYGTYRYSLGLIPIYIALTNEEEWVKKIFFGFQLIFLVIFVFAFIVGFGMAI